MPKFWAPVLALYAPNIIPTYETYNFFKDASGNENPRPDIDLTVANFSPNFGTATKLLAVIHGYVDTDNGNLFHKKVTYFPAAGDDGVDAAGAIEPSDRPTAGTSVWAGAGASWVHNITPASFLTSENSLYLPLCLYSIKAGDSIASLYGSNGVGGANLTPYNSISKASCWSGTKTAGSNPAQPNTAKNMEMWLLDTDFAAGTPAPDKFFQHYGDSARTWLGVSALTGGWAAGNTANGNDASMNGFNETKWFTNQVGIKSSGYTAPLAGLQPSQPTNAPNVPILQNFQPGDSFPFAMLLLGRNADGGSFDEGNHYVFTAGDFVSGTSKVLDLLHLGCQFDKVDQVFSDCVTGF